MTNHWIDIKNADYIMIIGSNAAENHPISFKWVTEAMERRGAKLISIDPRFTRTSAKANMYVRIRSGTDIAFIGGMILHVLEDMRQNPGNYNIEYVSQYTNAAYIVKDQVLPADNGGVFSGWDATKKTYDKSAWNYKIEDATANKPYREAKLLSADWADWTERANADPTAAWGQLDVSCVLRLLYEHYKRYDRETVSRITGVSSEKLLEVYGEYAKSGAKDKAGTIMYAMGTTQHTYGTQNIRAYSILQSLLGNMGIAGGGINALRGTSNVQGSTDMGLLSHLIPGYIGIPNDTDTELGTQNASGVWTKDSGYLKRVTPAATKNPDGVAGNSSNWKQHFPKYVVSMLKSWWRDVDPGVSFHYLPKIKASGENYTHIGLIEAIAEGLVKGLIIWGQNPASGGPASLGARNALGKLEWLVVADIWETETAEFWKRPGATPGDIGTEVFLLPAAASYEKEGSVSNSGRWVQWRYKSVNPPGEAKPDLEIMDELMRKIKELYGTSGGTYPDPIVNLTWDYVQPVTSDEVAQEVNGKALQEFTPSGRTAPYAPGDLIDSFLHLQANGSTSCGNWIISQVYAKASAAELESFPDLIKQVNGVNVINRARRRLASDPAQDPTGLNSNWTWSWPVNRRIIYNRASIDLNGDSWDPNRTILTWNAEAKAWKGDVVDGFGANGPINAETDAAKRVLPFIMNADGMARLWGGATMNDGPLPEVYEPWESPFDTNLMGHSQLNDPTAYYANPTTGFAVDGVDQNPKGTVADGFEYVATTYRCTDHWQTGIMTRNLPLLNELSPNMYVELGEDLADGLGIKAGDRVKVSSARGSIEAVAVVTKRLAAITCGDRTIHHVGILNHWGYSGLSKGDSGNVLTPHIGDANTSIPEYKTFLCKVEKA